MFTTLVMTVIGDDKPGLVDRLAEVIVENEGNWLESQLAHLANKFAGIVTVQVPSEKADALRAAVEGMRQLHVHVETTGDRSQLDGTSLTLDVVGQDRQGIVRKIAHCLAEAGINVEQLHSNCESAPMSGEQLFRATIQVRVPEGADLETLNEAIEEIASDLMVDVTLSEEP